MKFFVFQRIRKVRWHEHIGLEAMIVSLQARPDDEPKFDMIVQVLAPSVHLEPGFLPHLLATGDQVSAIRSQWEPAIGPDELAEETEERIEGVAA